MKKSLPLLNIVSKKLGLSCRHQCLLLLAIILGYIAGLAAALFYSVGPYRMILWSGVGAALFAGLGALLHAYVYSKYKNTNSSCLD